MSASREKRKRQEVYQQTGTKEKPKKKKGMSRTSIIVTVIICAVLVLGITTTALFSNGVFNPVIPAVTVGTETFTVSDLNFYYAQSYANYLKSAEESGYATVGNIPDPNISLKKQDYPIGGDEIHTWDDFFKQEAVASLQQLGAVLTEARAAGYQLTDEDKAQVDMIMTSITDAAKKQGIPIGEYMLTQYGKGITLDSFRKVMEMQALMAGYEKSVRDSYTFTDEEIDKGYQTNKDTIDTVTYRSFLVNPPAAETPAPEASPAPAESGAPSPSSEVPAAANSPEASAPATAESPAPNADSASDVTPEDGDAAPQEPELSPEAAAAQAERESLAKVAEAKANEFLGKITDEASFAKLAKEYAPEAEKASYDDETKSLKEKASKSSAGVSGEWLFDPARKSGDKTIVYDAAPNGYYVVYFINRERPETVPIDVRHILAMATEDETATPTEQQTKEAHERAQGWYDEWLAGEKTEDSFAAMAKEMSQDPGSAILGGLYQQVVPGRMVKTFNDWCFDSARKPGDTGLVDTEYGTHVMYFVKHDDPAWKIQTRNILVEEKYSSATFTYEAKYVPATNGFGMFMAG